MTVSIFLFNSNKAKLNLHDLLKFKLAVITNELLNKEDGTTLINATLLMLQGHIINGNNYDPVFKHRTIGRLLSVSRF